MSDWVKTETHAKCGGLSVVVPSGSVNGGSIVYCLNCMLAAERERDALLAAIEKAGMLVKVDDKGVTYITLSARTLRSDH